MIWVFENGRKKGKEFYLLQKVGTLCNEAQYSASIWYWYTGNFRDDWIKWSFLFLYIPSNRVPTLPGKP